ncbi:hypothetical protein CPAR01_16112 [Colletotrichum paranaense]|uniref:Uncharacterized protein n=3 Tax=Colletotrichum acutatum species complex TaxID=2707335 RepID=A0AAI9UFF0_9PEZI|nr:uncharacterized protein CPAR01_16112 [Colletotrichum paranaense]KAK1457396.1 hypothetical protein CMEL01_15876 [Colletotrichum melonis]KAK1457907.1 hypothetical protein CCUS01_09556 [Colletotrichum cuscutae]KAK1517248.1 hypothetical protein CPAR01_16112 [Colletotrichum paranaense]
MPQGKKKKASRVPRPPSAPKGPKPKHLQEEMNEEAYERILLRYGEDHEFVQRARITLDKKKNQGSSSKDPQGGQSSKG